MASREAGWMARTCCSGGGEYPSRYLYNADVSCEIDAFRIFGFSFLKGKWGNLSFRKRRFLILISFDRISCTSMHFSLV